ncbi:hypothetical protein PR048_001709, partial [Dryococelus australis]
MKQQDEPPESPVTDEVEIVRDLQALQRDIQPADITNEDLDDDQIISAVLQVDAEEDNTYNEDKGDSERLNHTTAKKVFELALKYIEQQQATSMGIMWAKK